MLRPREMLLLQVGGQETCCVLSTWSSPGQKWGGIGRWLSFPQRPLLLENNGTCSSRDSRFILGVPPLKFLPISSPWYFLASLETKTNLSCKNVTVLNLNSWLLNLKITFIPWIQSHSLLHKADEQLPGLSRGFWSIRKQNKHRGAWEHIQKNQWNILPPRAATLNWKLLLIFCKQLTNFIDVLHPTQYAYVLWKIRKYKKIENARMSCQLPLYPLPQRKGFLFYLMFWSGSI